MNGKTLLIALCASVLASCPSMGRGSHQAAATGGGEVPPDKVTSPTPLGAFTVPQEIYTQTFSEVEKLIARLNEIIAEKDYDDWLAYLSPGYVETTGSPAYLSEASKSPILQSQKIVLKNLKDYFLHVVVPSRVQAKLSEISFIDKTHVKAISLINGQPVILYWLVWIDSRWMIGVP